jgi:pyrroline-5-carboxylate reductase
LGVVGRLSGEGSTTLRRVKLGFAGSGNMAAAMARGWAAGSGGPEAMLFADAGSGRAAALAQELGGERVGSLRELAERADAVVLAVKPAGLYEAARELAEAPAVVSVLGATSVARLRDVFPGRPVLRTMPTVLVEIRKAVICHAPLIAADGDLGAQLLEMLGRLGRLVEVPDEKLDAATAVMGCTPAYVALFAEALGVAGARAGLDPELAHDLVLDTFAGTAELLRLHEPAALRDAVASPGGSTEAGLAALAERGVAEGIGAAVDASLARMRG